MTRHELIAELEGLTPQCFQMPIRDKQTLLFWIWWHGASTESNKVSPSPPSEDYIESKLTSKPDYLRSIDDAKGVIRKGRYWVLAVGKTRPDEPLYGAQVFDGQAMTAGAESTVSEALALVLAALKDRAVDDHRIHRGDADPLSGPLEEPPA